MPYNSAYTSCPHILTTSLADRPCSVAVGAAAYSSINKLLTDKTLRLHRNSPDQGEH